MLRLAFVTGTEPGKWFARYRDTTGSGLEDIPSDDPVALLIDGTATLALTRLPDPRIGEPGQRYHQVKLYTEQPGVAVPKDSVYAEVGEPVRTGDLADEIVNFRFSAAGEAHEGGSGSIDDLRTALQIVAANVGVAYAPAPLLKVLAKKQVRVLELVDPAADAETEIALVWAVADDSEAVQDFVGVAKGRTRNSSRGSREASKSEPRSERSRAKVNRKVNGKSGAQRKGAARKLPKKGGRKRYK